MLVCPGGWSAALEVFSVERATSITSRAFIPIHKKTKNTIMRRGPEWFSSFGRKNKPAQAHAASPAHPVKREYLNSPSPCDETILTCAAGTGTTR